MNEAFRAHVEQLHPKFERLMAMAPTSISGLTRSAEQSGVYLLSEGEQHLYVGRSRQIRARLRGHLGHYAGASFAVKLARETTGRLASYKIEHSAAQLLKEPIFAAAFLTAKDRIRGMQVRFVVEEDSNRQALLEIYATLSLDTRYNDFETH